MTPTSVTTALHTLSGFASNLYAILPYPSTTLTASAVAGTIGLAVLDGTTLTWRSAGLTLDGGQVVSLGYDGLIASTTTAVYQTLGLEGENGTESSTTFAGAGGRTTVSGTDFGTAGTGGPATSGMSAMSSGSASITNSVVAVGGPGQTEPVVTAMGASTSTGDGASGVCCRLGAALVSIAAFAWLALTAV
ncbi:hypothetical protein B0A50_03958 [Salinomyces thailandicus]|uniref:Uncharacterized protein n=1 Tax=Salinomyces thailandicus TaxID=706561 RepID=A0A4U0TZ87_9PEZI|nr:hypothetical protein B0A50_03958 [Salinomyces thailandica]